MNKSKINLKKSIAVISQPRGTRGLFASKPKVVSSSAMQPTANPASESATLTSQSVTEPAACLSLTEPQLSVFPSFTRSVSRALAAAGPPPLEPCTAPIIEAPDEIAPTKKRRRKIQVIYAPILYYFIIIIIIIIIIILLLLLYFYFYYYYYYCIILNFIFFYFIDLFIYFFTKIIVSDEI